MFKKILQIFLFIGLFISFIFTSFAFESNISLDKNKVDINDYLNLKIEVNSLTWWEIWISKINWIENFDIISKSQSQRSSNSIVIINWKTQSKIKTSFNLNLTLKAKVKWNYTIWPVILNRNKEEVKTNSLNITITWDKLYLNNNHLNISTNTGSISNDKIKSPVVEKKIEKYENVDKKIFNNNVSLYLFIVIIILLVLVFYILIRKRPNLLNKDYNKEGSIDQDSNTSQVDFENKKIEIVYPEVNDDDFINKISEILRIKLWNKYNIKWVKNKTFWEILNSIWDKNNTEIKVLISMIDRAKYSNYIWDNNKILELVKNFISFSW